MTKQLVVSIKGVDQITPVTRKVIGDILRVGKSALTANLSMGRAAGGMVRSVLSLKTAFGALAAGLAVRQVAASFTDAANQLDDIAKTARRLGVDAKELSALKYQADLAGVSWQELGTAIRDGQKNLGQFVAEGKGRAAPTIRALGVSIRNADGSVRSMSSLLPDLARAFERLGSDQERVAAAQRLFGESGTKMLNVFEVGAEKLAAYRREAERLGVVFSSDQLNAAEEYGDAVTRVQTAWLGLRANLVAEVGPTLTKLLNQTAGVIAAVPEIIGNVTRAVRTALNEDGTVRRRFEILFDQLAWLAGAAGQRSMELFVAGVVDMSRLLAPAVMQFLVPTLKREAVSLAVEVGASFFEGLGGVLGDSRTKALAAVVSNSKYALLAELGFEPADFANIQEGLQRGFAEIRLNSTVGKVLVEAGAELRALGGDVVRTTDALFGIAEALSKTSIEASHAGGSIHRFDDDVESTADAWTQLKSGLASGFEEMRQKAQDLEGAARDAVTSVTLSVSGGLFDAFADVAEGTKSLGSAFGDLARSAVRDIGRIATQLLALRLLTGIGLAGFGGAAFGGATAPAQAFTPGIAFANRGARNIRVPGFPGGGFVGGRGPNRDTVLAALTTGESVLNRRATRVNHDVIQHMNAGGRVEASGGGRGLTVHVTNNFSGTNATPKEIEQATVNGVLRALRNNPTFRDQLRGAL